MTKVQASLATKHGKLAQIAPAFAELLDWQLQLAEIDTDKFGSFDGSTPRHLSPKETVLAKAKAGAEFLGTRFGLASEGTIGLHPSNPLGTSDFELIGFVDLELGTELVVSHLSPKILAASLEITRDRDLPDLEAKFDLPNHALIIKCFSAGKVTTAKGITEAGEVKQILDLAMMDPHFERAVLETDFRAMHSPSRQRNIESCARLAAERLANHCPSCDYLGWGFTGFQFGLECRVCGHANQHIAKAELLGCVSCSYTQVYDLARRPAEPDNCLSCNP